MDIGFVFDSACQCEAASRPRAEARTIELWLVDQKRIGHCRLCSCIALACGVRGWACALTAPVSRATSARFL